MFCLQEVGRIKFELFADVVPKRAENFRYYQYRRCIRPTLKIFVFPLTRPCFSGIGWLVGKLFFLTFQITYSLNLIVNSPNLDN